MRKFPTLLATLALLSLSAGCTSTQVKEVSGGVAGVVFQTALDVSTGGLERRDEERKRRYAVPGRERTGCPQGCELAREWAAKAQVERMQRQIRRQERRTESETFQANFDDYMRALEEIEPSPGDPPSIVMAEQ